MPFHPTLRIVRTAALAALSLTGLAGAQDSSSVPVIVGEIGKLEQQRDPKCYATASRLEDFMYGTPLESDARFAKIDLQKGLIRQVWDAASAAASAVRVERIDAEFLRPFVRQVLDYRRDERGDYLVAAPDGSVATLSERDRRQYGNVAYGLRALLAVEQENLLRAESNTALTDDAVELFKELVDVATLAVLQRADRAARLSDRDRVEEDQILAAWRFWLPALSAGGEPLPSESPSPETVTPQASERFATIRAIVAEKLAAYEAYNELTSQVFLRNLQVYFARYRWPTDADEGIAFRDGFNQAMTRFASDLLLDSERIARAAGHRLIRVRGRRPARCSASSRTRSTPTRTSSTSRGCRVTGGSPSRPTTSTPSGTPACTGSTSSKCSTTRASRATLEPDPFAAELLAEGVAQFGGLVLRVAGRVATEEGAPTLRAEHVDRALRRVQELLDANARAAVERRVRSNGSRRAPRRAVAAPGSYFTDVTSASGVRFEHRMADWLQRLLRSYTQTTRRRRQARRAARLRRRRHRRRGRRRRRRHRPAPALGGAGNALYLNDGRGRFADVTAAAGLDWRRPDGRAGEPRQPLARRLRQRRAARPPDHLRRATTTASIATSATIASRTSPPRPVSVARGASAGRRSPSTTTATACSTCSSPTSATTRNGVLPTLARRNDNGLAEPALPQPGRPALRGRDRRQRARQHRAGPRRRRTPTSTATAAQDLIVGNDFGVNAYYRNLGGGKFEDVAARLGTDKPSYTMNIGITDLNRDGFPDVYVSNIVTMDKDEKYVLPGRADTTMKFDPQKHGHHARGRGQRPLPLACAKDGTSRRATSSRDAVGRGVTSTGWAWGADFFDFDNDGDDDLYCRERDERVRRLLEHEPLLHRRRGRAARRRHPGLATGVQRLLRQPRRQAAQRVGSGAAPTGWATRAAASYLDLDGDGDLDMALSNFQAPAVLLPQQQRAPRRAIGSRCGWSATRRAASTATRSEPASRSRRAHLGDLSREVYSSTGYLTAPPKEQHFGLGEDRTADLTVIWPNGDRQRFAGIAADRRYRVDQGLGIVELPKVGTAK